MATWDAKDPRWLVKDRDDGKNVNGWHWQEHNRLSWSRQRLAELCTGLPAKLDNSLGQAKITGLKEATGEVCLSKCNQEILWWPLMEVDSHFLSAVWKQTCQHLTWCHSSSLTALSNFDAGNRQ